MKTVLSILSVLGFCASAQAANTTLIQCSGNSSSTGVILADLIETPQNEKYVEVTAQYKSRYFLVTDETSGGDRFYTAQEFDPASGQALASTIELKVPRILMNKGLLNIDGIRVQLECRSSGAGRVRAL